MALKRKFKGDTGDGCSSTITTENHVRFMKSVECHILPASIPKVQMNIFKTKLITYGGIVNDELCRTTGYIVVDTSIDSSRLQRLVDTKTIDMEKAVVVNTKWLSDCYREQKQLPIEQYRLYMPTQCCSQKSQECIGSGVVNIGKTDSLLENTNEPQPKYPKVGLMFTKKESPESVFAQHVSHTEDSDYRSSDNEEPDVDVVKGNAPLPIGHWVCAHSSNTQPVNRNQHITEMLEEMVSTYQSTNDKWRVFGYQKAIQALKKYPKQISTWEEAKSLPGVGQRLADKIWEIAESGHLQKLDEFKSSEEVRIINMFADVWGAGPTTARAWYHMGFKSLDDVKDKANLTKQQKIGLAHYNDFLERMPREEAAKIFKTVHDGIMALNPKSIAIACGSYRRGKSTCGDVDVLITHPDGFSHKALFTDLLKSLKNDDFITDDLVNIEVNGNQKKYMGVCRLKEENAKYRRIDIISVPYNEYACALMHFTGSAHFNRSIRHLAKKMNMSLSEHSLRVGVLRNEGEKIFGGTPVPTPTEESIFQHFGLLYRDPEQRDH